MTTSLEVTPVASSTPAGTRSVPSIRWTQPLLYLTRNGEKSNATTLLAPSVEQLFSPGGAGGSGGGALRWRGIRKTSSKMAARRRSRVSRSKATLASFRLVLETMAACDRIGDWVWYR